MRLLVAFIALLSSVPAVAQVELRSNLLLNGSGESTSGKALGKSRKARFYELSDWSSGDNRFVSQGGTWGKIAAVAGERFMRSKNNAGGFIQQDVSLTSGSRGRPRHLLCSALMRNEDGMDQAELGLTLLDAGGNTLSSSTTGRQRTKSWVEYRLIAAVPSKAVTARVTLRTVKKSGTLCDAAFDDVALEAIGDGFPSTLASSPAKDLIAELGETAQENRARRRGLLSAMVGNGSDEVVRFLQAQLNDTEATTQREGLTELLALTQNPRVAPLFKELLISNDVRARKHALQLARHLAFDWRSHLAKAISASSNADLRKNWLKTLADGSPGSLKRLSGLYRVKNAGRQLEILTAMRGRYDAKDTLSKFLRPHCRRKANGALRHEAMRHLADSRHPSFLEYLSQLYDAEGDGGRRSQWILWCGAYDNLDALSVMMMVVVGGDVIREGAFIDAVGKMKSKKVGGHVRRRWVESDEPILRKASIRLMTTAPWPGDLNELHDMCRDPDQDIALAALHGLAATKQPQASRLIERFLDHDTVRRAPRVVAAALRALWQATQGSDATVSRAMEMANDALEWQARATAIQLLAPKHAAHAREAIVAAFEDTKRQVRVAAYDAMTWLRTPSTVELLIDVLDHEETYVAHFVGDSLANLTGVHLGIEPQAWRGWWKQVRADFKCPKRPTATNKPVPSSGTVTRYYNIPIRSDRIVFIIDLSGSMGGKIKGITKLQAAKNELIRVLEQLSPKQHHFNVIGFGNRPIPYAPDLQRASKTEVRDAIEYVKKLRLGGATNIYDSLEMALDMSDLESIFLLTDGSPTAGAIIRPDGILEVMRRDNSYLRVRINTISIGGNSSADSFMKLLANQNWGTATDQ